MCRCGSMLELGRLVVDMVLAFGGGSRRVDELGDTKVNGRRAGVKVKELKVEKGP